MVDKKIKIFIVEDDKFLRSLIVRKLTAVGYDIDVASDGEEALKKLGEKKEMPDLVLLDLILPGIDGFSVLQKIKNDTDLAKIPVIILSNLGQKFEIQRGMSLGAVDYMVKANFTPDEIVDRIKTTLAK